MPGSIDHKSQAVHNENLLHEDLFKSGKTMYCDWVVTISFYSALHLIDGVLAADFGCAYIYSHGSRRSLVDKHLSEGAKDVFGLYEALYNDSRRARYDCTQMTEKQASHAVNLFTQIKAKLK